VVYRHDPIVQVAGGGVDSAGCKGHGESTMDSGFSEVERRNR